jgi:hypothetical protein
LLPTTIYQLQAYPLQVVSGVGVNGQAQRLPIVSSVGTEQLLTQKQMFFQQDRRELLLLEQLQLSLRQT